jgi:hypothetical protein
MGRCRHPGLLEEMSIAVAAGTAVSAWARVNRVPISTARHWSALPGFKKRVDTHRKTLTRLALEKIAEASALKIVTPADREPVRLPVPA